MLAAAAGCATDPVRGAKMARYVPRIGNRSPWLWEEDLPGAARPAPAPGPAVARPPVAAPVSGPPPAPAAKESPARPKGAPAPAGSQPGASPSRTLRRGDMVTVHLRAIPSPEDIQEILDDKGCVTLTYIGQIRLEGMTTSEAEAAIEKAYIDGQFYPKIDAIVVAEAEEYFVRGEVARPGRYPLMRDMTLLQALAAAGGYTDFASAKIRVFRGTQALDFNVKRIERGSSGNPLVKPGDIIVARRRLLWW
jgi:polysaccharide export outer membrane protein